MKTQVEPVSEKALDCFIHGVAHLIDEHGHQRGMVTAESLLNLIDEHLKMSVTTPTSKSSSAGR